MRPARDRQAHRFGNRPQAGGVRTKRNRIGASRKKSPPRPATLIASDYDFAVASDFAVAFDFAVECVAAGSASSNRAAVGLRWFAVGLQLVCSWFAVGLQLVCSWFAVGLQLVCSWFAVGLQSVCSWFAVAVLCVLCGNPSSSPVPS